MQALIDTRAEIERWADHEVTFHFCHILSPWIRRGLVAGGFGIALNEEQRARIPVEITPIVGHPTVSEDSDGFLFRDLRNEPKQDEEAIQTSRSAASSATDFEGSLVSTLTPYFHFDISSAVRAAEKDAAISDRSPQSASGSFRKGDDEEFRKGEEEF